MQINLTQSEIKKAITQYVQSFMDFPEGTELNIDFQLTRNPAGCTASIDIVPAQAELPTGLEEEPVEEEMVDDEVKEETVSSPLVQVFEEAQAQSQTLKKSFFDNKYTC